MAAAMPDVKEATMFAFDLQIVSANFPFFLFLIKQVS